MKVAVYLFILFTALLSCVEAQFKKNVIRSLLSPRQSTSDCIDIVPERCTKDIENATSSFFFSIICGDCNDEYIRFYECEGNTTFVEQIIGAYCAVNDDGEYCGVVYLNELAI